MQPPILSVVIPLYNGAAFIEATLRSLAEQTRRDFEVIVVDDGSTDGGGAAVTAFAEGLGADGPAVVLIRQDNAGVSATRNRGMAAASADLIGFLDADDLWAPDKVACHVALLAARPDIDLSFSGFDYIDTAGRNLFEGVTPREGVLPFEQLMIKNYIHNSTVVARRSALAACGGFDVSLSNYEDYDLWLKVAALRPANVYAFRRSLAFYRRHGAQATRDWRKMREGWGRVSARLAAEHREAWAKVEPRSWVCHAEYCASLAYNAGEIAEMRRLMAELWERAGLRVLRQKDALVMTGVWLVTYLPRPLQIVVGRAVYLLRKLVRSARA